jgi:hypothetical protein
MSKYNWVISGAGHMAEVNLSQAEADSLLAMETHRAEDSEYDFPQFGQSLTVPLLSADRREDFLLDVNRGMVNIAKIKYQNRARQIVVLARLDLCGQPHRNPDDQEIPCPHLHLYREGYGDKWAVVPSRAHFRNLSDRWATLEDFMRLCNITRPPVIRKGLFP